MPFKPYALNLSPETLQAAQQAFDMAWTEIEAGSEGYDMQLARDLLAKLIVEAALKGERDPEQLKDYALDGFDP